MSRPRSVELLADEQARRSQLRWAREREPSHRGVVAISRLPGARGDEVARRLSAALGYDLFDREILQQIARNVHVGEGVVSALDEKDRPLLNDWLMTFAGEAHLSTYEYLHELRRAVGAIAHKGGAVIVGRGAHLILGPREALRVLVVAPLEVRIATVSAEAGLDRSAAQARIGAEEAARHAFLLKHFHAELGNPETFDLVVNTHVLGVDGAVETIKAALARLARGRNAA